MAGRRKPYTSKGITRVRCAVLGCTHKARYTWSICADGNAQRAICPEHDVALNTMVMRWAFADTREADITKYRRKVLE